MSCEKPLVAVKLGVNRDTGKQVIHILPMSSRADWNIQKVERIYGKENIVLLPCGHCPSCIMANRKQWSVRCEMEAKMHEKSCFITLTYDDEHLPQKLNKQHLKGFIKSIRNRGFKVRYFGCGEGFPHRNHYHIILFGFFPDDCKFYKKSKSGEDIFTSKYVSDLWNKGIATVQEFTAKTAGYVAGYTSKKFGDGYEGFLIMSRKPGLGYSYMQENIDHLNKYQLFVGSKGLIAHLPRYFDKVAEGLGYSVLEIKDEEREQMRDIENMKMNQYKVENREELYSIEGQMMKDKLGRLKREL